MWTHKRILSVFVCRLMALTNEYIQKPTIGNVMKNRLEKIRIKTNRAKSKSNPFNPILSINTHNNVTVTNATATNRMNRRNADFLFMD